MKSSIKGIFKDIKGIKSIRESFKTRQVKYGGYAALMTLVVLVGLLLVNLIVGQFSLQVDMTETRIFSLSPQSLQVLDSVTTPVRIFGLWRPGERMPLPNRRDYIEDVTAVINLYTARNSNVTMEVIDPDRNPGFVVRFDRDRRGIARGSVIVEGVNGFRVISPQEMYDITQTQAGIDITGVAIERRITSALLFLGTGVTPMVYEIVGHGSLPLAAIGMDEELERDNLALGSVNLLMSPVPADASVLVLNHPQRDIAPVEAERLLEFLGNGGRLLVIADYNIRELDNLNTVFASYGFRFEYGILNEADPTYAVFDSRSTRPSVLNHEITAPLMNRENTPILLFEAMSVAPVEPRRQSIDIMPLLLSSSAAFLRTDIDNTSLTMLPADIPGPHILAAAVSDPSWVREGEAQARIVVIGSGALLPLAAGGFIWNRDLFLNSLAWLQDRPETISVRSKSLFRLPLRLNSLQTLIFGGLFIFVIPMAFFTTGFVTWLKRRHL